MSSLPTPDTSDDTNLSYPLPLYHLANHYYLYNTTHISHLRRHHNIPGVLIGSLPQAPQQNFFLGLPVQLLAEEARLLVEKGVCYVVEDAAVHRRGLRELREEERKRYLVGLREQGREISRGVARRQEGNTERALKGMSEEKRALVLRKREEARLRAVTAEAEARKVEVDEEEAEKEEEDDEDDALFPSYSRGTPTPSAQPPPRPSTPASIAPSSHTPNSTTPHHFITPTTSTSLIPLPTPPASPSPTSTTTTSTLHPAPPTYPLYAHLHSHNYFLTPGLRFGCTYTAYPGDPLRFHSHFLCRGYGWDEEIELLDLVGGGRLGTGVKKGFLVGGVERDGDGDGEGEQGRVRTFCIEWGGM